MPQLQERACDDTFMIPGPARDTLKGLPTFALGAPYYGAGFVLIGPPGTWRYLEFLKKKKDLLDYGRFFDACDHFHRTAAAFTGLDPNLEHPFNRFAHVMETWRVGAGSLAMSAWSRPRRGHLSTRSVV